VVGNEKELALSGAVFAEYEAAKNLRIRGEYAWIPRGNISESLSGTYEVSAGKWKFIFDPRDYELEGEDISEVHLAGTFNSWDPNNFDYPLEKNEEENVWEGIFEIAKGEMFKWIVDGQWTPDGMGNDLELKEKAPDAPLSNGQLYMAEANYKVFDTMRSFRNGIHSYSFDITGGYEVLENQAYLPLALDNLAADKELGHNKVYVYGYLYPQKNNNLRFTLDAYYQTAHEDKETEVKESEELSIYSLTPGFEFPEPFSGIEYIKAYVNIGKRKGVIENGTEKLSYDWTDSRHGGFEEIRSISGEIKTKAVGPLNYFLFSVNNEENLKVNDENKFDSVSEIFVETELNIPVEQIAYTKMNLDYKLNDETAGEQREPRYWVETKIHHIPGVEKYLTHFLISYESDQDGIIDEGIYNDNNNDWQKRAYAETKLIIPEVENFELTLSVEAQELEEGVYPDLEDLDKELNARYVAKGKLIEWYTFALITAAYDFPYGIRADLSLKYDLNHNEISKYEDDALKLELSKILNEYTTLKGSYNSKHPDYSSEQFINIGLETLF